MSQTLLLISSTKTPFKLDVEVVDILRDKQDLQFKRDSEAKDHDHGWLPGN